MLCISLTSDTTSESGLLLSFVSPEQTSASAVDLLPPLPSAEPHNVTWAQTASPFDPSVAAVHVFRQMRLYSPPGGHEEEKLRNTGTDDTNKAAAGLTLEVQHENGENTLKTEGGTKQRKRNER